MGSPFTTKNIIALVAICLSALMLGLEISSIPTILPTLEKVMGINFNQLQWIMTAYTIAVTSLLMAMGTLADKYGRKNIFLISIIIFGIASLVCGLTTSASVLIAARFFQGASGGAMLATQVAILSHQFQSGKERAVAFSWWGIIFGAGLGFGPLVGGTIIALYSWKWVFLIHVVIALITFVLAKIGVNESTDPHASKLDVGGIITISLSVFCVVYSITQARQLSHPLFITIVSIAITSFIAFIFIENATLRPMFDFSAFKIPKLSGALLGSCGMNFSFWPFIIYLPIYFHSVLGYDSFTSGLVLLAYTLPTLVIPPYAEKMLVHYGAGRVIPLGLFVIGLGFSFMLIGSLVSHPSWITMIPGCIIAGIGLGLTNTPVTNAVTGALPPERSGMAGAMDFSARMISLAINIAIMGFIIITGIQNSLSHQLSFLSRGSVNSASEKIATGMLSGIENINMNNALKALETGFHWVLTYGVVSVWFLCLASFMVFRMRARSVDSPITVQKNLEVH